MKKLFLPLLFVFMAAPWSSHAQKPAASGKLSEVWVPDLGNGMYKNPVIFADYSDPDVCRKADDYYLVASSFDAVPGLPILHSKDLVNWTIIGHALLRQPPYKHFSRTQHGNGVWAPAIRWHKDSFYIFYPDPDYGIYVIKAAKAAGPWTKPLLIKKGKGLIDPCPFWDDDGKAYLVHAFAGSRAGIKSVLAINRMNSQGTRLLDQGVIVYDGHGVDPTVEGPKLYKRNGYYYIFAPAGGVPHGYQLVLRSKNIYGPYERKVVMSQGNTSINGPHQGAWVRTPDGKQDWFIHFRDMEAYGRVTYLEPMKWVDNWPVIGVDKDGDGTGEPVERYRKPDVGKTWPKATPQTSDEFNGLKPGLQWQWQANPEETWMYMTGTSLRLYAQTLAKDHKNEWDVPAVLMQKFPADRFTATTKVTFHARHEGERTGFLVMGADYAGLSLTRTATGLRLDYFTCHKADEGAPEKLTTLSEAADSTMYLKVTVEKDATCRFSYSTDGSHYEQAGGPFHAVPGRWIGAKLGLYCSDTLRTNDSGCADFDWFRVTAVK
jgi:beta-xylosidase